MGVELGITRSDPRPAGQNVGKVLSDSLAVAGGVEGNGWTAGRDSNSLPYIPLDELK